MPSAQQFMIIMVMIVLIIILIFIISIQTKSKKVSSLSKNIHKELSTKANIIYNIVGKLMKMMKADAVSSWYSSVHVIIQSEGVK